MVPKGFLLGQPCGLKRQISSPPWGNEHAALEPIPPAWCKLRMMSDLEQPNQYLAVQEPYPPPEIYVYQPAVPPRPRYWLHISLFVGTIGSTLLVGGWVYSAGVLTILTAHEFGHYLDR